jgi:copper transport protein
MLVACGAVLAFVQLRTLAALFETSYGFWLQVKLALFVAMLGLAAINRMRYTPRLSTDARAAPALRRNIALELLLGLLIIGITAWLGQLVPPRAEAQVAGQSSVPALALHALDTRTKTQIHVVVSPARAGVNRLAIRLTTDSGTPQSALDVSVSLSNPSHGIEPQRHAAIVSGDTYIVDRAQLAPAGTWELDVDATLGEFDKARFTMQLPIREETR